jgi:hypothetical protein
MDRRYTIDIASKWIWLSMLEHGIDDVSIASQNSLVQRDFGPCVDTWVSLFEYVGQDVEVFKACCIQEIVDEVLFVQKDVNVIVVIRKQNSCSLGIRSLTGQMQRCSYNILPVFAAFLSFELPQVLELTHAHIDGFDRVPWKLINQVVSIFLYCHSERSFVFQVETVWILQETNAAVRVELVDLTEHVEGFVHPLCIPLILLDSSLDFETFLFFDQRFELGFVKDFGGLSAPRSQTLL